MKIYVSTVRAKDNISFDVQLFVKPEAAREHLELLYNFHGPHVHRSAEELDNFRKEMKDAGAFYDGRYYYEVLEKWVNEEEESK